MYTIIIRRDVKPKSKGNDEKIFQNLTVTF